MDFIKDTVSLLKKHYIPIGLGFTITFLLVSFASPIIFTQPAFTQNMDFTAKGAIGDTIGGLMNPFIAIAASILTFMAFYIQYKANQEVRMQFRIQQFESQFYEMLRLHKENVNEVSVLENKITFMSMRNTQSNLINVTGRKAFEELDKELNIIYEVVKEKYSDTIVDRNLFLNKAYHIFFFGLNSNQNKLEFELSSLLDDTLSEADKKIDQKIFESLNRKKGNKDLFIGNSTYLAHLYRHLYLTVKFIAKQDNSFLSYEEKRKYLRVLRAQLSNPEQALLFYNWKSGFGNQWEQQDVEGTNNSTKNKFFTDYRMIHNLYDDILHEDFKLDSIHEFKRDFKKEKDREKDPLFEFEEW